MLSRQNGTRVEAVAPFYFSDMLTLLAESKTMSGTQLPQTAETLESHRPVFEDTADELMNYLSTLTPAQISEKLGVSAQLGIKARNLAYDFPHKSMGYPALTAFTGEAFRGLEADTLPEEAIDRANEDLKFISSVYGLLNADDIIKPYRMEFNKPIFPDNKTSIQTYKPKITTSLAKLIKNNKINDIIDLLPNDADKCIDWKIIRAFTKVHKVVFQVMGQDGKFKTPIAKRLKELRGLMARIILMENIESFKQLTEVENDQFIFSPELSKPGLPVFISD